KKWKRNQCQQRELGIEIKHHAENNHHLQNRGHALLDSVDQHALDRVHVLDDSRHQIAGRAIIEPAERQQLNMRIQVASQIEDYALLKSVVQNDPERVEAVLKQERHEREPDERQKF